ncbi:MAG: Leu/Phe/Val dehydrogenase [Magnetovibrionaceae bacterium]
MPEPLSIFDSPHMDDHEQVVFVSDAEAGLRAIIAVHSTALGPALGGCRMWSYASEPEALADVLRLSKGMSYKNALAGLPYGGGKSVILGDSAWAKTPSLFKAMGRAVERLGGAYIIAEDVGTSPADMAEVATETVHVMGLEGQGGDPSPATALGTFEGIKAAVRHRLGKADLAGLRVAVQGLGHVGWLLAEHLHLAGAELVVSDLDSLAVAGAVAQFDATAVEPEAIYGADVDVFAPCALGAVINDDTIGRLQAKVIAGSANNQLATEAHARGCKDRGILYAPDYVINAGGVIQIHYEGVQGDAEAAVEAVRAIGKTLERIFAQADRDAMTPLRAANVIAEHRLRGPDKVAAE